MKKKSLLSSLILISLAGCTISPLNNTPVSTNTDKISFSSFSASTKQVEDFVDQKRIENTLGVLTGVNSLSDGSKITERATPEAKKKTKDYIISYLEKFGYKVERQVYKTGENLVATLPAETTSSEYILIGGHFDTVRTAGADDNGSAVSAVMESAVALSNLKNRKVNILFTFFDEEERGLLGSGFMAKEYKKQGKNITSVHTLDMVGWDSDKDKAIEIEQPDGILWDYYVGVNKAHNLKLPLTRTSSGSTDHEAFRAAGFDSVGMCEEWAGDDTTPYYHKPGDTYQTVNFEYLTAVTRLATAVLGDMATKVQYPTGKFIPHNMFKGRDRTFINY